MICEKMDGIQAYNVEGEGELDVTDILTRASRYQKALSQNKEAGFKKVAFRTISVTIGVQA